MTCPLCEAMCGLRVRVDGDRVTDIRGNRDDVWSQGHLCPKGTSLGQLHTDPDRLRAPMVRTRDGVHVPVSWDDAYAEVERVLRPVLDRTAPPPSPSTSATRSRTTSASAPTSAR